MKNLLRDKAFKKILVSYTLILLIPLLMGIAFCAIIGGAADEQMSERIVSQNGSIRTYFDSTLNEVMAYGRSLTQNTLLRSYIDIGDERSILAGERISFGEISSLLDVYSEKYIESCEVYYRENRSILRSGSRRTSDFVESYLRDGYGTTETELLQNAHRTELYIARTGGGWKAYIVLPVISSRSYDLSGLLLVNLNLGTILSEMDAYSQDKSSAFLLSDSFYLNKSYSGEMPPDFASGNDFFSGVLGQGAVTSTSASQYGVSIVTALMTSDYYKPVYRVVWLTAAYFFACSAFGLVYAYRESRKRYAIFERLHGIVPRGRDGDVVRSIEQSMRNMSRMKDSFDRYRKDSVKERFLYNLLVLDSPGLSGTLDMFDIPSGHDSYAVFLIEALNIEDIFHGDEELDDMEQYESLNAIVRSVFGEISSELDVSTSFVSVSQNVIAAVANFGGEHDFGSLFSGYARFIEDHFGIKLMWSKGVTVQNVSSFHHSYETALDGLNTLRRTETTSTPAESDVDMWDKNGAFSGLYRKLFNSIVAGSYAEISSSVREMQRLGMFDPSLGRVSRYRRDTVQNALRLFLLEKAGGDEVFDERLNNAGSIFPDSLLGVIDSLAESEAENAAAGEDADIRHGSGKRIVAFISENLSDERLDLNYIAHTVGLSNSYISRIFKQYSGLTLHEYINLSRIQKVKEMLAGTNSSVTDIARACGFSNTRTLVRAMQKYEGVSPSRYRQMYGDKNQ